MGPWCEPGRGGTRLQHVTPILGAGKETREQTKAYLLSAFGLASLCPRVQTPKGDWWPLTFAPALEESATWSTHPGNMLLILLDWMLFRAHS